MKENPIEKIVNKIQLYFRGNLAGILLYGSRSNGKNKESSDYDIAVILNENEKNSNFKNFEFTNNLNCELDIKIDMVIFNDTSTILKMQILKNHKILYLNNRLKYIELIVKTLTQYSDFKIMRREIERKINSGVVYA